MQQSYVEDVEFVVSDGLIGLKEVNAKVFSTILIPLLKCTKRGNEFHGRDREMILGDFKWVYSALDLQKA